MSGHRLYFSKISTKKHPLISAYVLERADPKMSLDSKMEFIILSKPMNVDDLEKQAIQAAIKGAWIKAINLNRQLIKENSKNIAALNRLARAYWELGKTDQAKKIYKNTLTLDPYNSIAIKNLQRLSKKRKKPQQTKIIYTSDLFIEEPGKTKTVKLIKLASFETLSELNNGQPVKLIPKKRVINVMTEEEIYLGTIPDDLSLRLIKLLRGGNRYQAFIKAVDQQHLEIFIRETFRSKCFHNLPSFSPSGRSYIPYLSPGALYKERPETTPTGEETEE